MSGYMRDSDYMGMLPDGNLYVLLTNTTREGAVIVQDRFEKNGYKTEIRGDDVSMSQRMKLFIFLLIINLIVVVFYLIWNYICRKEKIGSVWMKAVMMLLCPVTGPAFVFLSFLLFKLFSSQGMDLSDVVFSKDRKENFLRPDEEMERNMVSLEEALEVTDKKSLRTLMLNVIRGDYRNSLAAINLALNSEDSETAHYAASVLQDVLNDFRSKYRQIIFYARKKMNSKVEKLYKT